MLVALIYILAFVTSSTNGKIAPIKNVPNLGGSVQLGDLYDGHHDLVMGPNNLWTQNTIETKKVVLPTPTARNDFCATQDELDRLNAIGITASLKLSFMGGLISITGSAAYVHDQALKTNQVEATLTYKARTVTERMPIDVLPENTKLCNLVGSNQEYKPTHVVTEIVRGMDVYMKFRKTFSKKEEKRNIQGSLNIAIKSLPTIQINGDGTVKMDETELDFAQSLEFKFFGNVHLETYPTTYVEAVKIYKDLPNYLNRTQSVVAFRACFSIKKSLSINAF